MATIKSSYTDLEQSKKLAEILLLESADMYYILMPDGTYNHFPLNGRKTELAENTDIPCWSLAALLGVLPKNLNIGRPSLESNYKGYYWIQYYDEFMKPNNYKTKCFNNPIDACVAMIEKLHELKIL